jgi:hypothetical protein
MEDMEKQQAEEKEEQAAQPAAQQVAQTPAVEAGAGGQAQAMAQKDREILVLKTNLEGLEAKVKNLDEALAAAAGSYRTLVVQGNPAILPELITGASITEIEESVKRAQEIVARVKKGVETELARDRFPAGAPERGGNEANLSPRDKIQRGISRD